MTTNDKYRANSCTAISSFLSTNRISHLAKSINQIAKPFTKTFAANALLTWIILTLGAITARAGRFIAGDSVASGIADGIAAAVAAVAAALEMYQAQNLARQQPKPRNEECLYLLYISISLEISVATSLAGLAGLAGSVGLVATTTIAENGGLTPQHVRARVKRAIISERQAIGLVGLARGSLTEEFLRIRYISDLLNIVKRSIARLGGVTSQETLEAVAEKFAKAAEYIAEKIEDLGAKKTIERAIGLGLLEKLNSVGVLKTTGLAIGFFGGGKIALRSLMSLEKNILNFIEEIIPIYQERVDIHKLGIVFVCTILSRLTSGSVTVATEIMVLSLIAGFLSAGFSASLNRLSAFLKCTDKQFLTIEHTAEITIEGFSQSMR